MDKYLIKVIKFRLFYIATLSCTIAVTILKFTIENE